MCANSSLPALQVIDMFEASNMLGPGIHVACQKHPERQAVISNVEDWALLAADGGCTLNCDQRLPCGHACSRCAPSVGGNWQRCAPCRVWPTSRPTCCAQQVSQRRPCPPPRAVPQAVQPAARVRPPLLTAVLRRVR